jgi:hypothetical protein
LSTKSKIRVKKRPVSSVHPQVHPCDDADLSTTYLISTALSGGTLGCVGKLVLVACQEHFCVQGELCSDKAAAHSSSSCEAACDSDASGDAADTGLTLTRVREFLQCVGLSLGSCSDACVHFPRITQTHAHPHRVPPYLCPTTLVDTHTRTPTRVISPTAARSHTANRTHLQCERGVSVADLFAQRVGPQHIFQKGFS